MKCDVEEIVEELPEDADLTTDVSQSSNISLPSTPTSTPDSITRLDTSIETAPHEAMASSSDRTPSVDRDSLVVPNSDSGPVLVPSAPHKEGKDASPASASDTMTSGSELSATPMPMQLNSEERESTPGVRTVGVTKEGQGATAVDNRGGRGGKSGPNSQDYRYATLSRVRKFKVDGKDVESVTKKIVDVTSNRTLRDSKKYQQMRLEASFNITTVCVCMLTQLHAGLHLGEARVFAPWICVALIIYIFLFSCLRPRWLCFCWSFSVCWQDFFKGYGRISMFVRKWIMG